MSNATYHVFLSHNSADKPLVERLATRLEAEAGMKVFFDKLDLVPGKPWQEALEEALEDSETCAVLLGAAGLGPWQNEELRVAHAKSVRNQEFRVIPVWLPGADPQNNDNLPRFLERLAWVDFRNGIEDQEAFDRLIAGIRGQAPGRGTVTTGAAAIASALVAKATPKKSSIWKLPYRRNLNFSGRDSLLEKVRETLAAAPTHAVAITGLSGIGKTQLSVEFAFRYAQDYRLVWWVRAEEPTKLAADFATLAHDLDLPQKAEPDERKIIEAVQNWLERNDENWLLIFDNAPDAAAVKNYLPQSSTGHVLITSHNPTWRRIAAIG